MLKQSDYLQSILFGLLTIVLLFITVSNAAAEKWEVISELPTQRNGFATAVVDGKIYLIGGTLFKNKRGPFGLPTVEVYDPETNTWERLADMPTARAGARTAVVDGKIYVLAGYTGKDRRGENFKFLKAVEMYDPATDTWVGKQDISIPRIQFGTGVVAGKIYAIGGVVSPLDIKPGDPWRLDLVEVYDPATDTWTKRADMSTRRDGVRAAVIRDTIYAIGGFGWPQAGAGGPSLETIEVYEPRINRWTKKSDMPNPRAGFSAVVIADKIYLIGGYAMPAGGVGRGERLASTEVYDPINERWHLVPTAPTLRAFSTVAVNGKIYAFGGSTEDREYLPTVEVFDTGFRAVTARDKLPVRWGTLKAERQN